MKSVFFIMLVLVGCASVAQNSSDVIRVEFTSLTRGYQEQIVITADSLLFSKSQAGEAKVEKARTITKEEWSEVIKMLQKVILSEIPELKSPSMKRAYDGARHSTISITAKSGQVYQHTFDDENPHQKLEPLMKLIEKMRGKM